MKLLEYMEEYGYEQVVLCQDKSAGLKAIIVIHDTTLGPALGGVRMWNYTSEDEATLDALRLARAMTYKAAAAGLNLGGGKAVIIGDPARDKSEAIFRSLGQFIGTLCGRYIATEDLGTTAEDMEYISTETSYVTGLPAYLGGSGDPSPSTAYGILRAIEACTKEVFGSGSLKGRTVAIQGLGKVGSELGWLLYREGATIIASEIDTEVVKRSRREINASIVLPEDIYDVECSIFCPCALGGIINNETIPRLKCRIIAGGANNQLVEDKCAAELEKKNILYAPDYIANAGGLIQLSLELTGYDADVAKAKVARIYDTMEEVIALAKLEHISTSEAADVIAEKRLNQVRRTRKIYQ